ncbi:MAG TPA: hypothetical protein VLD67_08820 [Vicinamibacterales bacterium]|nr:hypothetical protein [Vicinamibacterales bacterium]
MRVDPFTVKGSRRAVDTAIGLILSAGIGNAGARLVLGVALGVSLEMAGREREDGDG